MILSKYISSHVLFFFFCYFFFPFIFSCIQINNTYAQDSAIKERQLAVVNNLQIQYQWRKLMRIAKEEELKRDIEVIAQSHERG